MKKTMNGKEAALVDEIERRIREITDYRTKAKLGVNVASLSGELMALVSLREWMKGNLEL